MILAALQQKTKLRNVGARQKNAIVRLRVLTDPSSLILGKSDESGKPDKSADLCRIFYSLVDKGKGRIKKRLDR